MCCAQKPPGKLLPFLRILVEARIPGNATPSASTDVPVTLRAPAVRTRKVHRNSFYIMDYVEGRVQHQPLLGDVEQSQPPADLPLENRDHGGQLHNVELESRRPGKAMARAGGLHSTPDQRWSGQFEASRTGDMPAYGCLMAAARATCRKAITRTIVPMVTSRIGQPEILHPNRTQGGIDPGTGNWDPWATPLSDLFALLLACLYHLPFRGEWR